MPWTGVSCNADGGVPENLSAAQGASLERLVLTESPTQTCRYSVPIPPQLGSRTSTSATMRSRARPGEAERNAYIFSIECFRVPLCSLMPAREQTGEPRRRLQRSNHLEGAITAVRELIFYVDQIEGGWMASLEELCRGRWAGRSASTTSTARSCSNLTMLGASASRRTASLAPPGEPRPAEEP